MVQPGSQHDERRAREQGELPKGALHSSTAATGAGSEARAVPILAEPGTAIVFDKDLLHAGAPNLSSNIRYALYFRMRLLK
jgi:ectoine hydroxylase-related dioxygenase (phytanoyl-CoA dioxygenase family)